MKKRFEKALRAKQAQRVKNAARPAAEKLAVVERLRDASSALKRPRAVASGRGTKF